MKKLIALLLACVMVLGLVACGSKEAAKTEEGGWPGGHKEVTVLIPQDVGSMLDQSTRIMVDYLNETLPNTKFIVENDDSGGGNKVYYFAPGIGIVRTENEYCGGARTAVYELSAYEGTGEGYMPMADGLVRRYDAIGLTDGFVGAVEYTYVQDDAGHIVIFKDATGIRELPPPMSQYSMIQTEVIEDQLWEAGKHNESRLRHDVNNFHLLCHFFGRPSRYWAAQEKAVAWNKYRLHVMEGLGDGAVPGGEGEILCSTDLRCFCHGLRCGLRGLCGDGLGSTQPARAGFHCFDILILCRRCRFGICLHWGGRTAAGEQDCCYQ